MKEKPSTPFPANAEQIEKSRRESDARLVEMGAEAVITTGGKEFEDQLQKEFKKEATETLYEWIALNKTIVVPFDEMPGDLKTIVEQNGKGAFARSEGSNFVYYVDTQKNLARFQMPFDGQVREFSASGVTKDRLTVKGKLAQLGFRELPSLADAFYRAGVHREQELERRARLATKEGFNL